MKVGPDFFSHIHTEKTPTRHYSQEYTSSTRYPFFLFFLILLAAVLILRLGYVQLVRGSYYRQLSDSNRIRSIPIHAPRGIIFDRNGNPLVYNVPGYREVIGGKTLFLTQQQAVPLLAKGDTHLEIDDLRMYPCQSACTHVVGYIGQISPSDLKNPLFANYLPTDVVGQMGAEQYYEPFLKGIDGAKLIEVDASGNVIRTLGQTDPIPGQNITLTIDEKLQQEVASVMSGVPKGAAIVSKPDGEILALYSAPSFDPNLFTMGKDYTASSGATYKTVASVLLDGQGQPLLDRAISGTYPPGSTFKILVAAAALQNHIIDQNFTVLDTGILHVGNFSFSNWEYTDDGKTDGEVNVVKALQRSNDIFFYKVGEMVGVDTLSNFVKNFGLGSPTGIDLIGEASGLLPTKEWKEKTFGQPWYLGDDYDYGIGQGYLLTTPLQVNLWTQAIANNGTLYLPHILASIKPTVKATNLLTTQNTDIIRQGMIEVCDTGGVAYPLFNFTVTNPHLKIDGENITPPESATPSADARHVVIACKTGSAQTGGPNTPSDAWLTAFAPAYKPQIIVTVLSETSGEGSDVAGPIAEQIFKYYFSGEK